MTDKATAMASPALLGRLNVIQQDRLKRERTEKDYAIEFGEYLAVEAERFMDHHNTKIYPTETDADVGVDRWNALKSAIYEFRKRAAKAEVSA